MLDDRAFAERRFYLIINSVGFDRTSAGEKQDLGVGWNFAADLFNLSASEMEPGRVVKREIIHCSRTIEERPLPATLTIPNTSSASTL